MRTRVQVAAAAVLVAGVVGGCSQTVPGTVAMTTEPGAPISESSPSTSPRTTTPGAPGAPGVAQTITCGEFMDLSAEEQAAVIGEIFGNYGDMVGTEERTPCGWPPTPCASSCPRTSHSTTSCWAARLRSGLASQPWPTPTNP